MRASTTGILGIAAVIVIAQAMSSAQERRRPSPSGMRDPGGLMLLMIPEVQADLRLEPFQTRQIQDWFERTGEELRGVAASLNLGEFPEPTPEARERLDQELQSKTEAVQKDAETRLRAILSNRQWNRVQQLRRQAEGVLAFQRDDVIRDLGLTATQREKLEALSRIARGPRTPEERQRDLDAAIALLTNAQKETWKRLQGVAFAFPDPPDFAPGPGFGPGFGPGGPGGFGPGGPGGFGFGGPGGFNPGQERPLVKQFDEDQDGRLSREERAAARDFLKSQPTRGPGVRGPGGPRFGFGGPGGRPGGPGGSRETPKTGARVTPEDVVSFPEASLYEPTVVRTLFLQFEAEDWESELSDFNNTDVEVPATVSVDGKTFPNVGVHFRGMSSYMMVPAGSKRSLNLAFDFVDSEQRLYGYKTVNLLNSHEDPSFLHTVLYFDVARKYIPAPKANFVRVVINGEDWGLYVNVQQFNKELLSDSGLGEKGARWKVAGSPGGRGGLEYLGEEIDAYRSRYTIKSKDSEKDWKALIQLCRTLNETPVDQLEAALDPLLDLEGVLWFLALENALVNSDGYWARASDYSIARDQMGKFHIIPHDANETFQVGGGPGMRGSGGRGPEGRGPDGRGPEGRGPEGRGPEGRGPEGRGPEGRGPEGRGPEGRGPEGRGPEGRGPEGRGPEGRGPEGRGFGPPMRGGIDLDPLIGLEDSTKPLRSRLLAVPSLRARYLAHVRTIAEEHLDWSRLQPIVDSYVELIDQAVESDPKKLSSYEAFRQAVASEPSTEESRGRLSLREFADQRRAFLLNSAEIKALPREAP